MQFERVAALGAGLIGASWTALFLASGRSVAVFDPAAAIETSVREFVETAWPTLEALGLASEGNPDAVTFHGSAADALDGATFVQESVSERIAIKHALYAEIEPALADGAVVASSTSGLTLTELQACWKDPSRLVLAHPFNPPHLIPLVEVMGNRATADGVVEATERFYQAIGKVTIRVRREVPGHVANRLQAAIWREAIHLVKEGVVSVQDADKAVWAGPGLRWAAMGPTMLFHLGAGEGGLASYCDRYADSFNRWWDDLGDLHLDAGTIKLLVEGMTEAAGGQSPADLSARRDALITAMQKATEELRRNEEF